jgi:hypothetical protein
MNLVVLAGVQCVERNLGVFDLNREGSISA